MKKLLLLSLFITNTAFAQQLFPGADRKCISVKKSCSYDSFATCTYTYCGNEMYQPMLEEFISKNHILGKKFNSIIEVEDYFKTHLPKELSKLQLRIVGEGVSITEYNGQRITITITKNNYIVKVKIG